MREYAFRDAVQVISYIRFKNPARQKSVNLLEADSGSSSSTQDDISDWCLITSRTFKVLRSYGQDDAKRVAFEWFYFAPERPNIREIATNFGKSERTIWRWLNHVLSDLTRVYRALEILPPADKWEQQEDDAA